MKLKYFRPVSISLVLSRVYEKRLLKQLTIYHLLTININLATEKNHSNVINKTTRRHQKCNEKQ